MLKYSPKVGEILECDFGPKYPMGADGTVDVAQLTTSMRYPPEMVKRRLVVVMNGKIEGGGVMVVPLSTSRNQTLITKQYHVLIGAELFQDMTYFKPVDCWAKADHIQQVSKQRLHILSGSRAQYMPPPTVTAIQRAVVLAINARTQLVPLAPAAEKEAANDEGAAAAAVGE